LKDIKKVNKRIEHSTLRLVITQSLVYNNLTFRCFVSYKGVGGEFLPTHIVFMPFKFPVLEVDLFCYRPILFWHIKKRIEEGRSVPRYRASLPT